MEQTVLTPAQKQVIALIAREPKLAVYYLSGGTALAAYHLHHRVSEDLDFFTREDPDAIFLPAFMERVREELGGKTVRAERLHDRRLFFLEVEDDDVKIEFTYYPFPQLESPVIQDGIRVDSLRDIAANKLAAILDRFDPKDFVDLFFILQRRQLEEVRADTEHKFRIKIDRLYLGGELAKVRRVEALPRMLQLLTVEELKTFFTHQVRELGKDIF